MAMHHDRNESTFRSWTSVSGQSTMPRLTVAPDSSFSPQIAVWIESRSSWVVVPKLDFAKLTRETSPIGRFIMGLIAMSRELTQTFTPDSHQ